MIPCHAIPQALHSRYTTALCFMTVLKCFHRQLIESSPFIHCYRYISLLPECSYNGKRPGKQDAYDHSDNVSVSHVVPPMNKLYTLLVRSGPFRSGAVRCSLNSELTPDWFASINWMTDIEQGSVTRAYVGNVVTITLMTESRVHAEDDVILTMPDGWKPLVQSDITAYYRNGCCVLRLHTDGTLKIWNIGDTTNAGRIYASFTYIRV